MYYGSYEKKSNSFKCTNNMREDLSKKTKEYIEFFDKEFDELIPPKEEWSTITCTDAE